MLSRRLKPESASACASDWRIYVVDGSEEAQLLVVGEGYLARYPVAAARDLRDPVTKTAVDGNALFIVCLARLNVVPGNVVLVDTGISELAVTLIPHTV